MRIVVLFIALSWSLFGPSVVFSAGADSGKSMYLQYCSACHGKDGRGGETVKGVGKVKIPDLTLLKNSNSGVYPTDWVIRAIDGRRKVRGHGDAQMPVWGYAFRAEFADPKVAEVATFQREKSIADYVATLQR